MDELLEILENDSRKSVEQLARLTGRSESDVRKAIADYEDRGIIKQYATVIDWDRAGRDRVLAFIDIKVTPVVARWDSNDIAERIYRFEEVSFPYGWFQVSLTFASLSKEKPSRKSACSSPKKLSTINRNASRAQRRTFY